MVLKNKQLITKIQLHEKAKLTCKNLEGVQVLSRNELKKIGGGESSGSACKITVPNFCFSDTSCAVNEICINNCCTAQKISDKEVDPAVVQQVHLTAIVTIPIWGASQARKHASWKFQILGRYVLVHPIYRCI